MSCVLRISQEGEGVGAGQLARNPGAGANAAESRHAAGAAAVRRPHPLSADALPDCQLQPAGPQAPAGPLLGLLHRNLLPCACPGLARLRIRFPASGSRQGGSLGLIPWAFQRCPQHVR